jgi:hypothetical protein
LGTQALDNAKTAQETLEFVHRTENLLSEIDRGLQPLTNVQLTYQIVVSVDHVNLKNYLDRFYQELPGVISSLSHGQNQVPGITMTGYDLTGKLYDRRGQKVSLEDMERIRY